MYEAHLLPAKYAKHCGTPSSASERQQAWGRLQMPGPGSLQHMAIFEVYWQIMAQAMSRSYPGTLFHFTAS